MEPKFSIGQQVRIKGEAEVSKILSWHISSENPGVILYKISSKAIDIITKEINDAIKNVSEDALELFEEPKKEENVQTNPSK